jgi:sialic acid synthase SpsE
VARGACVLEKHFTLDHDLEGPDHKASLEPDQLAELVRAVRTVERALGDGIKRPVAAEQETKKVIQKTLVAARALPAGTRVASADLVLRRSGAGLPAACLPLVVGREVVRPVEANTAIDWGLLR